MGGDVSGQEWPSHERRDDRGHQGPERTEPQTSQEHRDIEPVRRHVRSAAEKIRRDPRQDRQRRYDPKRCRRGKIRERNRAQDPIKQMSWRRRVGLSRRFRDQWSIHSATHCEFEAELVNHGPMADRSWAVTTGFEMKSFAPASRQR